MKPFKEVPKEKLDDALNKLDLWSLGCVRYLPGCAATARLRCAALRLTSALLPRSSFKGQTPREAAWNVATRVLPCLLWMQHYDVKKQLLRDIAAGIAVTFLIIPQGLSYAGIAGLPAIYGLCACP